MDIGNFIESINVPVYSVTDKYDFFNIKEDLKKYNKDNPLEFCDDSIEERLDASFLLKDVGSIITILIPYELKGNIARADDLEIDAIVTNNAWEIDYHSQLRDKLIQIAKYIEREHDDLLYKCIVDTSPLIDRRIAYEAGLGCYGKSTFLINEELGTAFYIASLLINKKIDELGLEVEKKEKFVSDNNMRLKNDIYTSCDICLDCDKCVKYCPGHALNGDYTINSNKCVSYLTQKKGLLSYDERKLITNRLYGCDVCQIVCPYNKKTYAINDEYKRNTSNVLDAMQLISLSNKQLRKLYKLSGFIWRGPNILKRNAIIIIGNSKSEIGYEYLEKNYFKLSIEHRLYALWSMFNIDHTRFLDFIKLKLELLDEEEKLEINKLSNI